MNTRVYGAEKFDNLIVYSMGGHRDAVVGAFFEDNSLDVSSTPSHMSFFVKVFVFKNNLK